MYVRVRIIILTEVMLKWPNTTLYNTVQCSAVQYSTVQYSTVQYGAVQHSTVQYNTIQYNTIQYSTVQYNPGKKTMYTHTRSNLLRLLQELRSISMPLLLSSRAHWPTNNHNKTMYIYEIVCRFKGVKKRSKEKTIECESSDEMTESSLSSSCSKHY